jgi:hypothetical protein
MTWRVYGQSRSSLSRVAGSEDPFRNASMTLIDPLGSLEVQPFFDRIGVEKQQFNGAVGGELFFLNPPDIVTSILL